MTVFNYLIKGQAQIGVDDNKYIPIKEDDIYIHAIPTYETTFSFYGETMLLHIVLDKSEIEKRKDTYSIEYYKLLNKLFSITENEKNIIFKSEHKIKDILMDMRVYDAKDDISQRVYYQIKIIEIITYLYELNISAMDNNYKTYTDAQIRVVRKIKNHLSRDIASYISLEVLANSYGINLTTLKNCFRDMYGKPLYTWYREYKFLRAKELIKNTDYPISKIANMIGYKSSSKFTKAFKKEMGVLPSSYRKNKK
jgi:AraC-like DNA-binding protein